MTTLTTYGRQKEDALDVPLFNNVKYYIDKKLSLSKQRNVETGLQNHGAENVETESDATHIITQRNSAVKRNINEPPFYVSPPWVEQAIRNNFVHAPKFYSTDPDFFFSGMVVAVGGLPKNDQLYICAAMEQFGGQYREELSSDTTHYITVAKNEAKKAEEKYPNHPIRVVLPHFIDECIKFKRHVREDNYQFPDPYIMQNPLKEQEAEMEDIEKSIKECYGSIGYPLIFPPHGSQFNANKKYSIDLTQDPPGPYLEGECLYVEPDLMEKETDVLTSWMDYLEKKAGATFVKEYSKEQVTIVVVKHRSTPIYRRASIDNKIVASKWWLTNTIMRKEKYMPILTLVDYPMPSGGIADASAIWITISGYKDTARDYLRRLAIHCGMNISANLTRQTTHLICNSKSSEKWSKAKAMNKTVVNHVWLEQCFRDWTIHAINELSYLHFPGGAILRQLVGKMELRPDIVCLWYGEEKYRPKEIQRQVVTPAQIARGEVVRVSEPQSSKKRSTSKVSGLFKPKSKMLINSHDGQVHGRRVAAQKADHVLRESMIPDMNEYDKEKRGKRYQAPLLHSSSFDTDDGNKHGKQNIKNTAKQQKCIDATIPEEEEEEEENDDATVLPAGATVTSTRHKRNLMEKEGSELNIRGSKKPASERSPKRQKSDSSTDDESESNHESTKKHQEPLSQFSIPSPKPVSTQSTRAKSAEKEKASRKRPSKKDVNKLLQSTSPSSSTQRLSAQTVILFTGFKEDEIKPKKKKIREYSVDITDNVMKATHIVVKDKILKTSKFLRAVNLGLTIATEEWIDESLEAGKLLDAENYQVNDPTEKTVYKCNLQDSLQKARENRQASSSSSPSKQGTVFNGYIFHFLETDKAIKQELKLIVESGGGEVRIRIKFREHGKISLVSMNDCLNLLYIGHRGHQTS
ncbi:hypothetical protein BDA99DRAFT_500034 [Phascolomyces articulosus]|uniref:BRCT domain-containing protein n=1 Tax=Phascolomyces articulosus TaxID=60185 RepID=A0AAD5K7X4_9FUNG|nr:hypothetical protein BDA99DRAFT_500034 [Phascolomyces articulosus]